MLKILIVKYIIAKIKKKTHESSWLTIEIIRKWFTPLPQGGWMAINYLPPTPEWNYGGDGNVPPEFWQPTFLNPEIVLQGAKKA